MNTNEYKVLDVIPKAFSICWSADFGSHSLAVLLDGPFSVCKSPVAASLGVAWNQIGSTPLSAAINPKELP
jgi:hypothetical protein